MKRSWAEEKTPSNGWSISSLSVSLWTCHRIRPDGHEVFPNAHPGISSGQWFKLSALYLKVRSLGLWRAKSKHRRFLAEPWGRRGIRMTRFDSSVKPCWCRTSCREQKSYLRPQPTFWQVAAISALLQCEKTFSGLLILDGEFLLPCSKKP